MHRTVFSLSFLLLAALAAANPECSRAQANPFCGGGKQPNVTNSGRDFLLVYMQNEVADYEPLAADSQEVFVSALGAAATVTVTCKSTGYFKQFALAPYQNISVLLNLNPSQSVIVNSDEEVDNAVVRVVSSADIVCYGMNHKAFSADAFLALPKQVLTTSYMVMAYANSTDSSFGGNDHPSEFAVASFEDGNSVTITPAALTAKGTVAGTPVTYTLDAGQCIQIQADTREPEGDLTGSLVSSTKTVAVFGGHRRTEVPHGYSFGLDGGRRQSSRDHLAEQIPPVSTWGKAFIATNFIPKRRSDLFEVMRVLASADKDTVWLDGHIWTVLATGQYQDFIVDYADPRPINVVSVQTSEPSLVGMFCHTADTVVGLWDPFFAIVQPLEQTYNDFTYYISSHREYSANNYLVVATERSGAGHVTINAGPPIPRSSYVDAAVPLYVSSIPKYYSVAIVPETPGFKRIQSPTSSENGFTILAYGYGIQDSYGYTAGSLYQPTNGIWRRPDPVGLPYPGNPQQPSFTIRNILGNESVWLDSLRITYTSNPEHIAVETKNLPMTYLGILPVAGEKRITLSPHTTPTQPITGKATMYYHSGLWFDMQPLETEFTIEPGTMASVGATNGPADAAVALYPNPVRTDATIAVTMPVAARATIRIFDALGRIVMTVSNAQPMSEGPNAVHLATGTLADGSYRYELSIPELGIVKRAGFIVKH